MANDTMTFNMANAVPSPQALPFANSLQRIGKHTAFATGECISLKRMANAFPVGECGGYAISLQRNGKWYYDTFYLYTFYCDGIQTK
jgi:hypothetical protein